MLTLDEAAQEVARSAENDPATLANTYMRAAESEEIPAIEAARALAAAKEFGLPQEMAITNPKEVMRLSRMTDMERTVATHPKLAQWLAEEKTRSLVASDDLAVMSALERTFWQGITEPVARGWKSFRRGQLLAQHTKPYDVIGGDSMNLAVALANRQREIDRYPIPDDIAQGMAQIGEAQTVGAAFRAILKNPRAVWETTLQSVGASAPALASAVGGSVVGPWGTAAGAGMGSFVVEYGNTLQEVLQVRGVNPADALAIHAAINDPETMQSARGRAITRGVPVAAFDALTAGLSGRLLARAGNLGVGIGGSAAALAGEASLQAAGGAAGEAAAQLVTGEYKPGDILLEAFAEIPGAFFEVPANYLHLREAVRQVEEGAQMLAHFSKLAKTSKVLERDPETFERFIESVSEDSPVSHVYIDAETLYQSGLAEQIAEVSPAVAREIGAARETGASIQVPVEEWAARIVPLKGSEALIEHLRTEPDGLSMAEAHEAIENAQVYMQDEIERAVAQADNADSFEQEVSAIREDVAGQLNKAGRFLPPVNAIYADFLAHWYATMAQRTGQTPAQLRERFPLRIVGATPAQLREQLSSPIADNAASPEEDGSHLGQALAEHPPRGWRHVTTGDAAAGLYEGRDKSEAVFFTNLAGKLTQDAPEIAGYSHSLGRSAVAHIRSRHGDAQSEASHGQVAVTAADIAAIPEIVTTYDAIRTDLMTQQNAQRIAYAKRFDDGTVVYIEDVSRKRNDLHGVTMWKFQPGIDPGQALENALSPEGGKTKARQGKQGGLMADALRSLSDYESDAQTPSTGSTIAQPGKELNQVRRGAFNPEQLIISLRNADLSTFLHETGHFFLHAQTIFANEIAQRAPDTISPAERQIVADTNALFQWFGARDLETWNALDFEEQRAHHEKFARGFERYLFSGKAPSLEMAGMFQRFAAWLKRIYGSIKAVFGDIDLTPEVRAVMDRMLATDAEIEMARRARSTMPMFASAEEAGMTVEEFAEYQAANSREVDEASTEMQAKSLRDLRWILKTRNREIQRLRREAREARAEIEAQVHAEVLAQPVYRAWNFLKTGEMAVQGDAARDTLGRFVSKDAPEPVKALKFDVHWLDLGALKEMYPSGEIAPFDFSPLVRRKLAKKGGLHPDMAAEIILDEDGNPVFDSGDAMVRELAVATPPHELISAQTDARMLAEHGELASPEAIARAAEEAIHSDARLRILATEANALAQASGSRKLVREAAREFARRTVGGQRIRDIAPGRYTRAESRAGRAAETARGKGDIAAAAAQKRSQVINAELARASMRVQDEVLQGVRYLRKFSRRDIKGLDAGYRDQIDVMLERFELRARTNREIDRATNLAAWLAAQKEDGIVPDVPPSLVEEAQRTHYRNLPMDEFRGLVETIRMLEHLGRLKNRLLTAKTAKDIAAVRAEIADSIRAAAGGETVDNTTRQSAGYRNRTRISQFLYSHVKAGALAQVLDGGVDGGPLWEYVIRAANEAGDRETTMIAEATGRLSEIMAPILKVQGEKMEGKGQWYASIGRSLNRAERFALALNVGNASNLQRLEGGNGWTMQDIEPVLESMTSKELLAVQAVWDHFETYRPMIAQKERRIFGRGPDWIEPQPLAVKSADGQEVALRGGYFPVRYDPARSSNRTSVDEDLDLRRPYTSETTRRGFVKPRVQEVHNRPILLTMRAIWDNTQDVIHDLAWHEWVIDARRLLLRGPVADAIRDTRGAEALDVFREWIGDVTEGGRGIGGFWDQFATTMRRHVSAMGLGLNAMTSAVQLLGFAQSAVRIGPRWLGLGIGRLMSGRGRLAREINEKSIFMANRGRTRFRELNEVMNTVQDQSAWQTWLSRYGYAPIMFVQSIVDRATWAGAYEKALARGEEDARAVALADQAVIDSQGSGMLKDLSEVERGRIGKLFTVFYAFMNTNLNMGFVSAKTAKTTGEAAAKLFVLFAFAPMLETLLREILTPDDDDEPDFERLARRLADNQLSFLFGSFIGLRELNNLSGLISGERRGSMSYGGPTGLRPIADLTTFAIQAEQGEFDAAFRKSLINLMGDFTGLPAAQINRTWTGIEALAEDETDNPAAILLGFQKSR
ncbi:MAG: hypothetical protein LBK55_04975 [Azoarcus sp.]|jgi:hypothetical protein|nr:hypothetical protein [Azoarcus sp.]